MKKMKWIPMLGLVFFTSCSVQQFSVNSNVQPFERGGKLWGEKTERYSVNNPNPKTMKSGDLHVFGINVKKSDTGVMAAALNVTSYTIETKSNLIFSILSGGIVDYKIVKVIKRDQ